MIIRSKAQIFPASINSGSPVFPQQLYFSSTPSQNIVFFGAPQKLAILALDEVVQLGEIARKLVQSLKQVLDGDVDHPAVKLEDVIKFLAICWQWLFGSLLSLFLKLLLAGFEGGVSGTLLIALLLLLHFLWIGRADPQVLVLEIEVPFEALSLDPRNDLLHFSLTDTAQVVVVPRSQALYTAIHLLSFSDFLKAFLGDAAIGGKLKQQLEIFLQLVALLGCGHFHGRATGQNLHQIFVIGHIWGFSDAIGRSLDQGRRGGALVDEIVKGTDDLRERFGDLLQFEIFSHDSIMRGVE